MNIHTLKRIIKRPLMIPAKIILRLGDLLSDDIYLKLQFFSVFGKRLNLKNPKTFNEKLQWLKLYNRKDEYTILVDKVKVKEWVKKRIGDEYIIPTLSVYKNVDDIDFDSLPKQFVLKTNHDSGGIIICKNKSELDIKLAKCKLKNSFKTNFYLWGREWPYKNIEKCILAEEYMVDESGYELKDYKIFCFNGKPEFIQVDFNRFGKSGHKRNLYSTDWKYLEFEYGYPTDSTHIINKPDNLKEMLNLASIISKGIPFLRVDFYSINGKTKFGEITFFPGSGYESFSNESLDTKYGEMIKLPNIN